MKTRTFSGLMIAAMALGACSDSTGPAPAGNETVSLSFSTNPGGPAAAPFGMRANMFGAQGDTLRSGTDELIIDRAQVVLREIELKRANVVDCMEEDDCEKFEIGPVLIDLPLNGATTQSVEVTIDPGTYTEIEFEVHKPGDDPADLEFVAANPGFDRTSIRVEGTFNGQTFVYTSDLDVEQEFDLMPPLVIDTAEVASNVTVRVDLSAWFVDGAGALIDPGTANKGQLNEGLVKENIKQSFEAFEDDDHDGDDQDEDN